MKKTKRKRKVQRERDRDRDRNRKYWTIGRWFVRGTNKSGRSLKYDGV